MKFKNIEELRADGFEGFNTVKELTENYSVIPNVKGVYLMLYLNNSKPCYLGKGSGGLVRGKDPNVHIAFLDKKWVDYTLVIYIGKAGGKDEKTTLRTRLKKYIEFGQGKNVSHYGGRLVWQLANAQDLLVCWKRLYDGEPRGVEKSLIADFEGVYRKIPFANLRH